MGSVLNGSRKTRWHTSRAATTIVMGSLTIFTTAVAVGARSLLLGLVAILCLAGVLALRKMEFSRRQTYGKAQRAFFTAPKEAKQSTKDSPAPTPADPVMVDTDIVAEPHQSAA